MRAPATERPRVGKIFGINNRAFIDLSLDAALTVVEQLVRLMPTM